MNNEPQKGTGSFRRKPSGDFLNYFGKDRPIHMWLADKRTRLIAAVFPRFVRLGLVPDTISYIGISMLAGVIVYFVREPVLAVCFLAAHLVCDGFDGAFARNSGKASQSGAFTDLACDQLGMVVVAIMAIFHHLVAPILGAVYIALYLIVVVFGVIINVLGLGTRITITSKYFLYLVYAIWAFRGVNYFPELMAFFSVVMGVEVVIGYLRLKRGIRKKFDTKVRFTAGDPYSGRLNYSLNVAVPIVVFVAIIVMANVVPIRATLATPTIEVSWKEEPDAVGDARTRKILAFGAADDRLLVLMRDPTGELNIRQFQPGEKQPAGKFSVPGYVEPAFSVLPVDDNVLMLADRSTHMLMGIDLEASFAAGRSVIVVTLPLGHLRVTAMTVGHWGGKKVWLVANYLYTRKTYVIDPEKAVKDGSILGGVEAWYINGAFPAGLVVNSDLVIDFNRSRFNSLLYTASLDRLIWGDDLLEVRQTAFRPPTPDALGPVLVNDHLVMLSRRGAVFRLPVKSVVK
jgi:phosphatidylglycerophosphate synthase